MDGKLAAARGERNPSGALYDVISDSVRLAACAAGLAVGLRDEPAAASVLVTAYVGIRFAVMAVAEARPRVPAPGAVPLPPPARALPPPGPRGPRARGPAPRPATAGALLRAAPRRSGLPGTTVDTEAVAFTLGPAVGLPAAGLAVAAAVDLLHLLVYVLAAVRSAIARS